MGLRPDMSIMARIAVIEDALAKVLDRGPEMAVEANESSCGDLAVFVIAAPWSDKRVAHDLYQIARELELML